MNHTRGRAVIAREMLYALDKELAETTPPEMLAQVGLLVAQREIA